MRLLTEEEYKKLQSRKLFLERRIAEDGLSEMAWTVVATVIAIPAAVLASAIGLRRGKWAVFAAVMTAGTFADFLVTQELTSRAQRQMDAVRGLLEAPNHAEERHKAVRAGILATDAVLDRTDRASERLIQLASATAPSTAEQAAVEEGQLSEARAREYRSVAAAAMREELAPARPFEKLFRSEEEAVAGLRLRSSKATLPVPPPASDRAKRPRDPDRALDRGSAPATGQLDEDLQALVHRARRLKRLQHSTKDAWLQRNVRMELGEVKGQLREEAQARGQAGALPGDMKEGADSGDGQGLWQSVRRWTGATAGGTVSTGAAAAPVGSVDVSEDGLPAEGSAPDPTQDPVGWLVDTAHWMRSRVRGSLGLKTPRRSPADDAGLEEQFQAQLKQEQERERERGEDEQGSKDGGRQ